MDPQTRDLVRQGVIRSAALSLPIMFKLMSDSKNATADWPLSVLDVGAGEGWWSLAALALRPKSIVVALDYEALFPDETPHPVSPWNAEAREPLPQIEDGSRWDLILCLEMIEHLTPEAGDWLVGEMCKHGTRIAFSAAIPRQGGDGHLNEQWPSYWQERFLQHGYTLSDPWRLQLWSIQDVEPWYAQNMLCARPLRNGEKEHGAAAPRAFVHPAFYNSRVGELDAARR